MKVGKLFSRMKRADFVSVSGLLAALIVFPGYMGAQSVERQGSSSSTSYSSSSRVSLVVKDSSLRYILTTLTRDAGIRLVYDADDRSFDKKVSVRIVDRPIMDALRDVLRGTQLVIVEMPDGKTITVRSPLDSSRNQGKAVGDISGRITDSLTGNAVGGVSVSVAGTSISAVTQPNGIFTLRNVPVGSQLLHARVVGYRTVTERVMVESDERAVVSIVIAPTNTVLNEVVTTATGQQRRVEIGNDIVRIDAEEILERAAVRSVADMIEAAQVPGVQISRGSGDPGSPSKIRLRGIGSISQSNDPVMIVDGVWVDAAVRSPSPYDNIDPANIESIEIIRGPSAATLYGQDAANGVIVITTKRGRSGPSRWDFSFNRDWGQTYGTRPLLYKGFGYHPATGTRMECGILEAAEQACLQDSVAIYDPNNPLLIREGSELNNRFSAQLSGGTDVVRYSLTASGNNTTGVRRIAPVTRIRLRLLGYDMPGEFDRPSTLDRRTISSNTTFIPRGDLTVGVAISGSRVTTRDNTFDGRYGHSGLLYDEWDADTLRMMTESNRIDAIRKPSTQSNVLFVGSIGWNPGEWVTSANLGVEGVFGDNSQYTSWTQCNSGLPCRDSTGSRSERSESRAMYSVRFNASRNLSLGRADRFLSIRPTFGGDFRKTQQSELYMDKENLPPGENSMGGGTLRGSSYYNVSNATAGWYLNSTIGILNRIYFDMGLRQDIGSAVSLTSSSQSLLPKLGGSWLISDEGFWPVNNLISVLRLRGAVGYATVQPDVVDIHGLYRTGYQFVDGAFVRSVTLTGPGNPILRPERSAETEIGIDADMWNDRLNLVATYAHKENKNTLVVRSLPPSASGDAAILRMKENIARVKNRSLEFSLLARVIETDNSLAQFNYTLTLSENLVTKLGDGILPFSSGVVGRVAAGYPLAGVWAPRIVGYRDVNEDGLLVMNELVLSDQAFYLGSSIPRYTAGYGISLATMQNRLKFDARFSYRSRYIQNYSPDGGQGRLFGLQDVNAPLSEQAYALAQLNGRRPVTDLRWNSASLTYHLSGDIVRLLRARSLAISLKGDNLALWTSYVGRDPGVNSNIITSELMRDNGDVVPRPRLFVLDFKIGY